MLSDQSAEPAAHLVQALPYRGTSFIRNDLLLGPYSRTIPRVLWWSLGGGAVLYERGPPVGLEDLRGSSLTPRPLRYGRATDSTLIPGPGALATMLEDQAAEPATPGFVSCHRRHADVTCIYMKTLTYFYIIHIYIYTYIYILADWPASEA